MKANDGVTEICPECGEPLVNITLDEHLMKTRPDIILEQLESYRKKIKELEAKILNTQKLNFYYDEEVQIVRAVCHNYLGEILKEEKLQDVVIFHLKNFKSKLERDMTS
jgi:ABC-type Fe3+-hydroxamate transport system substrate-binding protein